MDIQILADFDHDGIIDESDPAADSDRRFAVAIPFPKIPRDAELDSFRILGKVRPLDAGMLKVRLSGAIPPYSTLRLQIDENRRGGISLFWRRASGWRNLGPEGIWRLDLKESLDHSEFALGIVVDASAPVAEKGKAVSDFTLSASIIDGKGTEIATDSVRFKIAPFILASSIDQAEEVMVIKNDLTINFVKTLDRVLRQIGVPLKTIEFKNGPNYDVWVQDTVEIGRYLAPKRHSWGRF